MKRKLLLEAAEYLATIPKRQFDLEQWIRGDAKQRVLAGKKITKESKCGTIACAGGWLGTSKKFNDRGLKFIRRGEGRWAEVVLVLQTKHELVDDDPLEALATLFQISYSQADALFSYSTGGEYDNEIYAKHGEMDDHTLFQLRVKKVINAAKRQKGRK